jgi:hypothetical protein
MRSPTKINVHDKAAVNTKRAVSLWVEDMNRKHFQVDAQTVCEKCLATVHIFRKWTWLGTGAEKQIKKLKPVLVGLIPQYLVP